MKMIKSSLAHESKDKFDFQFRNSNSFQIQNMCSTLYNECFPSRLFEKLLFWIKFHILEEKLPM